MAADYRHPALAPFRLAVPETTLADLDRRLATTRWPAPAPGAPWRWGTDLDFMQSLVTHWRERFDWRHWEARLNAYPQYMAAMGDVDVHFIVEQGSGDNPLPLILTHGWPGSPFELIALIDPLAHPERYGGATADAFTVVVPSLPGFGLSPAPDTILGPRELASTWHCLMKDVLGFDRYVAHGGDTGATISSWMGLDHLPQLPAIHLNTPVVIADWTLESSPPDADEADFIERQRQRLSGEDAYQHLHAEKPATLSFALTDSPVGLAAWIAEKFHGWTAPGEQMLSTISLDHIIANVMVYWTGASAPVHWLYQSFRDMSGYRLPPGRRIDTPTGFCLFPNDIVVPPPRQWLERSYNVANVTLATQGGHFPGIESVELLTNDMRDFFRGHR